MKRINIYAPKKVGCEIRLPSSKSISNRALAINALAGNGSTPPNNISECDDTEVMINWLSKDEEVIDIKAAGTAMRFSTALLAIKEGVKTITGTERMCHRPISILVDALRTLGAKVEYLGEEGYPPLRITGNPNMEGGEVSIKSNISSQFISALMIIGPYMKKGLTIHLLGELISHSYIDLTMKTMSDYSAEVYWHDKSTIRVNPKPYKPILFTVESDWSAASYWYEIACLADEAEIILPDLYPDSYQGDSKGSEIFEKLGVKTEYLEGNVVRLTKTDKCVERLDYDFINQPDIAQTFAVCCCMKGIPFRFSGLQSLKIKETDRIKALRTELAKLGYDVQESDDRILYWNGERIQAEATPIIDTYEDHRMAMAFAPCAITLGNIQMNNPEVVSKSYPRYWDTLIEAGFKITEQQV